MIREYYKTKNSIKEKVLGKKLYSWGFGNNFWVKVFENGVKLRKRNQVEISLNDFEMFELNIVLDTFFKNRKKKIENQNMLNELEKETKNEKN